MRGKRGKRTDTNKIGLVTAILNLICGLINLLIIFNKYFN